MEKLKSYLFTNISQIFFSIFGTLFLITSVVFLVKIATLTSIIKIDFFELVLFYTYSLPKILFYTFPISLFISYLLAFSRLSSEYELIVITSLGLKPTTFIKFLLPITLISSVMMLVISLGLIPKADYLNDLLLEQKKKEASFNIKASQFGQKFGDWLIYIDKDDKLTYEGVKLFKDMKEENAYQFIISDKAQAQNSKGELDLTLFDGVTTRFGSVVNQVNFEKMFITDTLGDLKVEKFNNSFDYWKARLDASINRNFIIYILFSIFPLICLPLVISFGFYNPRYEKNNGMKYAIITISIFTIFIVYGSKVLGTNTIFVTFLGILLINYFMYQKKIKKLY